MPTHSQRLKRIERRLDQIRETIEFLNERKRKKMSLFYNPDPNCPHTLWAIYVGITQRIGHCKAIGRDTKALERARVQAERNYWDAVENHMPK